MKALLAGLAPALAVIMLGCTADVGGRSIPSSAASLATRTPTAAERALLEKSGVVISSEAHVPSFHLGYTALFKAHAPMYFTADALLHALHSSYDAILADVETAALSAELSTMLTELRAGLAKSAEGSAEVRADLDRYLAVAARLASDNAAPPVAGAKESEIAALVEAARMAGEPTSPTLFGEPTLIDFSMMKPRGHYTRTELLSRYFRAMMWLGRTEIRIAKKVEGSFRVNRRALGATILLQSLLSDKSERAWRRIDETTQAFVGPADSMSFSALARAVKNANLSRVQDLAGLGDAEVASALEREASQRIGSQMLQAGEHPIAFLTLGQRYVFDSDVFSSVTFGALPVKRMMPSPLDVGWGAFHNPVALTLLKPELDAYGYREALDKVKIRGEQAGPALWEGSLYHLWLHALGELSPNAERDAALPAVMRTETWGRRLLGTQLASWAELRHDNVLYAKESFTSMDLCAYPDAYVEPYPTFFAALEKLSSRGIALVEALDFGAHGAEKKRILGYFKRFGEVSGKLREMAALERDKKPLLPEHIDFINHAVSVDGRHAGCTMIWEAGGWYADLYYDKADVLEHKPTIVDVHTQPTDEDGNMVGKVLHVATGQPRLLTVTIDTCSGPVTYRGIVSSYHEIVTEKFQRMTDEEWWVQLGQRDKAPPEVPWLSALIAR